MHAPPHSIDDALLSEMRDAFGDDGFMELAFVIAQYISMGQLVAMLGIPNPDVSPLA